MGDREEDVAVNDLTIPDSSESEERLIFNQEASGSNPDPGAQKTKPLRHYCIVRDDLSPQKKMVHIGHASGESAVLREPPNNRTIFIALQASVKEIEAILPVLDRRGFKYVRITDVYEPFVGQLLAVGIEPSTRGVLTKTLFKFCTAE